MSEQEQTEKEHIKELIAYWPNEKFLVEFTPRQRKAALNLQLDDAADKFKRDKSLIVDMCDCRDANLFAFGKLPINNKHDPNAVFKMVRTKATKPGTCDFCRHTTFQARESKLDANGSLRYIKPLNESAVKARNPSHHETFLNKTHGYFTVIKTRLTEAKARGAGMRMLTLQCICGNVKEVKATNFTKAKSCGCRAYEYHGNKPKRKELKSEALR